jgi:hypothetical protein
MWRYRFIGGRRSVRWRDPGRHTDLIVWVEVGLVVVVSDLSVPGLQFWERDSATVREQDAWVPEWVSDPPFDSAP